MQDDMELLRKFTAAIETAREGGNLHVHVMPDRIIEVIRRRINDLQREYNHYKDREAWNICELIDKQQQEYEEAIRKILAAVMPK